MLPDLILKPDSGLIPETFFNFPADMKNSSARLFCNVLLIVLLCFPVFCPAAGKVRFSHLSVGNGLPHSDVNAIVQDNRGYIWIATYAGLCRWDGYRFQIYNSDNSEISTERILCLYASNDDLLYIGTESGGLDVLDLNKMTFLPVTYDVPFSDDVVNDIYEGLDGNIYICHNSVLSKVVREKNLVALQSFFWLPVHQSPVVSATQSDAGYIYLASGSNIYHVSLKDASYDVVSDDRISYFKDIRKLRNGNILAASDQGLFEFCPETHSFRSIEVSPRCRCISQDHLGDVWVGTVGDGLYRLDGESFAIKEHHRYAPFSEDHLSSSEVTSLYVDRSDVLWIGTIAGGVNITDLHTNNVELYTTTEGLSDNRVITFGEVLPRKSLWVSSHGGIDIMDLENNTFRPLDINGKPSRDFPIVSSFFMDSQGNLWLGTWNDGIWIIDKGKVSLNEDGRYLASAHHVSDPELDHRSIFKIVADKEENLWISSSAGLIVLDYRHHKFMQFRHDSGDYRSLSSDFLTDICVTEHGGVETIWIGTRSGLNMIRKDVSGLLDWRRVRINPQDGDDAEFISCIHEDRQGNIWVSALGGGLFRSVEGSLSTTPAFERVIPESGNFINNQMESLLEDVQGNLWLGGYGITRYSPATKEAVLYSDKDNLQSNSFKIWSSILLSDGRMAFGGTDGFNIFDPFGIIKNSYVPSVQISGLQVNGEAVASGDVLNLKYNRNNLHVEFSSLVFNNPRYNLYRYRLEGFEDSWHEEQGMNPGCVYSNLPSGKFKLVVYGSNSDGIWSDDPVCLDVNIHPHPLRSTFAYFVYFLFLVVASILLYQWSANRIKDKNERQVEKDKLRFFTDMAHEIKTPLSLISAPVEELLENPSIGQVTRQNLMLIDKSVNTLRSLVEQILDLRKYENNMMKIMVSEIDIRRLLTEIAALFEPLAAAKKICFRTEICDDAQMVYADKKKIERVVTNLLSNAFKFTGEGGCIVLSCKGDQKNVWFAVEDNGKGIREEDKDHIFERFYQVDNGNTSGSTGIGLSLSKYIIEHHKGDIKVESRVNFGSKFIVRLPKGKSHFDNSEVNESYTNSDNLCNYDRLSDYCADEIPPAPEKSATVLVVDDNNNLREYLYMVLSRKYNVLRASDGLEAYSLALSEQPDLILSDVVMPQMSGIELCQRVKNNPATSHIIVVLLTARDLATTEMESWQVGADGFITKPFHNGVLLSRIDNLIKSRDNLRKIFHNTIEVNPSEITIQTADEKLLTRCLEAIENNMSDPDFGVEELCQTVGVSRAQLYRKLNSITGLSIVQFIRSIRLKRAAQLLSQDNSSVSAVMFKVGFNNPSYFTKIFKEEFGCSPKDWHSDGNC